MLNRLFRQFCICFFFISFSLKGFSQERKIFIDFGPNDVANGNVTTNPDVNGNYWNNPIQSTTSAAELSLSDSKNIGTGITLKVIRDFSTNGIQNGGLLTPSSDLLGEMAIKTATQDYFFINGTVGSLKLSGFDPQKKYVFHMFANREAADVRISQYKFTGANTSIVTLQTTGSGIGNGGYNGNNNKIVESDTLYADASGTIIFELSSTAGSFAYVNAMKIEVFGDSGNTKFSLEDGGFESGNLDSWSVSESSTGVNTVVNTHSYSGTYALKTTGGNDEISQDITYVEGADYRFTGYLYHPSSDALQAGQSGLLQLSFYDKDKTLLLTKNSEELSSVSPSDQWLKVEIAAPVPAGTYFIKPALVRKSPSSTLGTIYFDGIKLEKYTPIHNNWTSLYIDLGPKDLTNGNITASPDVNGNYWNNLTNGNVTAEILPIFDSSNKFTGASAAVTRRFDTNGILNGGLLAPKAELLNDFAINTATQDYFFIDGSSAITFTGLSKAKKYVFHFFGSRESTETRISEFKLTGANTSTKELTTSGAGIGANGYNGNNNKVIVSDAVYPDPNGTITLNVKKITGSFAHLNALKIVASDKTDAENYTLDNQGFELENLNSWTKTAPDVGSIATVTNKLKNKGNFSLQMGGPTYNISQTITLLDAVSAYKLSGYFFQSSASLLTKTQTAYLVISYYDANNTLLSTSKSDAITSSSLSDKWIKVTAALAVPENTKHVNATVTWSNPDKGTGNIYFDDLALEVYNPLSITYFGSSVPWGQGATNNKGYTSLFTDILKSRESIGGNAWQPVNISVPGDNTVRVLNRYENDLLPQKGKYVVFALALGNEGIHEQGKPMFDQFESNMKILIDKARSDGYTPIITNNYTRGDYNETDYKFVKSMNLLIHGWNVPSINLLGAVDDLSGKWVNGFWSDSGHPNDAGHAELAYTIVPSLFDALESNKPMPKSEVGSYITLPKNVSKSKSIAFTPENIVHPFTTAVSFKASEPGKLLQIDNAEGSGTITINNNGFLVYTSAKSGGIVTGATKVNDDKWHKIIVTHYYAKGITMIYCDNTLQGSVSEKLVTKGVKIGGANIPKNLAFKNWLFYRSGMNLDEIKYLSEDSLLKSSLELYAPLDGKHVSVSDSLINLAQSTNTIKEISEDILPEDLSYTTPNRYIINSNIDPLTPTITGGANAYAVVPDLPAGLNLDPLTGVISGKPSVVTSEASYKITASNDAGSTSFEVVIAILADVTVKIGSQSDATYFGASDGKLTLSVSGGTEPYQYKLDNGAFQNSPSFTKLKAKQYIATVKDANGTMATIPCTIKEPSKLLIKLASKTEVIRYGTASGSIKAEASGGVAPYDYKLNEGTYQSDSRFENLASGDYTVTVKDANGATAMFQITLTQMNIPNLFSPNGDGINDNWVIADIESYAPHRLTIVDRTGRVIFTVKNYRNEWNGMWNGEFVKEGTYYYSIVFDNKDLPLRKGFITIVK